MIKRIYSTLKRANLNPYWPGIHTGECKERYCVVKDGTQTPSTQSNSVGYRIADIIIFVPFGSYVAIGKYAKEIKTILKDLPIRYAGETPIITDDGEKAYTTSIQYQVFKKMEG